MKITLSIIFMLVLTNINAQSIITQGKITFEEKLNMHKSMEDWSGGNSWAEEMKKRMPKYKLKNYDLLFNASASYYIKSKVQPEQDLKAFGFMQQDNPNDAIYKNLDSGSIIMEKQVFESKMLITDSLPKANWKLTNEFRKIADYNCRKATTIIMDSLYVIAFYTDAITCNSGPNTLNGLPGMIMGIVVPRLHLNVFATKVEPMADITDKIIVPAKGKKETFNSAGNKLGEAVKDWGRGGNAKARILWSMLL